ncbi:BMP family ABC transporter substrate-binding protein [Streptosporangium sp. NPDC051022]|uniref:BMP family ABC transporter substrate-binding protein n=1 Tax=Streptosporangium sp. NPDC051022 TaxID=3155752 RepID=UPI00343FC9DC
MNTSAKWSRAILATTVVSSLLATGCGSTLPASAGGGTAGRQPDVNGDGKVVVGVMSPGDTKDKGYYQSFVDEAKTFAEAHDWTVVILDKINPSDSITQAKNLCRQSVDLIAIGASELKDALSAAPEPVCKGVDWYINGGVGVEQTEHFAQSQQVIKEILFSGGVAAGLLLKESGSTKAGYISGPEVDFSKQAAAGFRAGLRAVVPEATLVETYTGDFNDSGKAREAAQAQLSLGVKVIYPYLGGATDVVASLARDKQVYTLTPGTDRCADDAGFDISMVFSPGAYFAAALGEFQKGTLTMGKARMWRIGVDDVPTVVMCGEHTRLQPQVDQFMADIAAGKFDIEALAGASGR